MLEVMFRILSYYKKENVNIINGKSITKVYIVLTEISFKFS